MAAFGWFHYIIFGRKCNFIAGFFCKNSLCLGFIETYVAFSASPKYRRKVFYREKRAAIGKILRQLCEWKGVKIIEAEACPDHIHLFVEIPPKMSVSSFMGYLKGKSSTMLYEQFGELKYKFRNREFWCRGYYVDTVGKNESRIAEYIKNQLQEDEMGEQLRIPSTSPFTGSK